MRRLLLFVLAVGLVFACSSPDARPVRIDAAAMKRLSGMLLLDEGDGLLPDRVLKVIPEDVSVLDVVAKVVAAPQFQMRGALSYLRSLSNPIANIDRRNRYTLRASLDRTPTRLSVSAVPVDPLNTESENMEIPLVTVVSHPDPPERKTSGAGVAMPPAASLVNTYWKLMVLRDVPVRMEVGQERESFLILQGQPPIARGFSGCNRFSGGYRLTGSQLAIGPLAGTKKACAVGLALEGQFFGVLDETVSFTITGDTLLLHDDQGVAIARLQAVYFD